MFRPEPAWLSAQDWDLIVIGGGITGAAVLREASRLGLRCLLLEQRDFAWGASSRSGKWVHGGLRYIKQGQLLTTWHAVRERDKLCAQLPGLIDIEGMHWPLYRRDWKGSLIIRAGLWLYDRMAGKRRRHPVSLTRLHEMFPGLEVPNLDGALCFYEGQTDDARLTLRLIQAAESSGAIALNYAEVTGLYQPESAGKTPVRGVYVDLGDAQPTRIPARQVIAATGAWADRLRVQSSQANAPRIRPLRGSHLVFDAARLPVRGTLITEHPHDRRPGFITPFQGRVIVGNTDLDHRQDLQQDAAITDAEVDYLLASVNHYFPSLNLQRNDILATFSGVRPVVDSGADDPSKEARDHAVWEEHELITIGGGKLTTFQHIARDALRRVRDKFPELKRLHRAGPPLSMPSHWPDKPSALNDAQFKRLAGRYGERLGEFLASADAKTLNIIPGTDTLWAELPWCARHEAVVKLDDLLLRRTRIGLLLAHGGAGLQQPIRKLVQPALGWDDTKWQEEWHRYSELWHRYYGVPDGTEDVPGSTKDKVSKENRDAV
ncbi:glycerol-3-phosphate dehydrogenase/oxidase [Saccharospirillum mangrovi]|uniref:glycerol-3-phosphate dehydrogenase/oxidase n=1 Tax=Saccharospirillum mangrovi TaxID=2161747 RepID=UPI0018E4DD3A|nr:glycerol-3-phosphate dehydrogenase/oxidase [Saccharospirillum mangrovi]